MSLKDEKKKLGKSKEVLSEGKASDVTVFREEFDGYDSRCAFCGSYDWEYCKMGYGSVIIQCSRCSDSYGSDRSVH